MSDVRSMSAIVVNYQGGALLLECLLSLEEQPGLLEVISTLPTSYPGHVLLTEDLGVVHGIDDGDWPGKRFSVLGRLPRAEARGCSDTYREA